MSIFQRHRYRTPAIMSIIFLKIVIKIFRDSLSCNEFIFVLGLPALEHYLTEAMRLNNLASWQYASVAFLIRQNEIRRERRELARKEKWGGVIARTLYKPPLTPLRYSLNRLHQLNRHVWTRKGRKSQVWRKGQVSLVSCRTSVPRRSSPPYAPQG